MEGEIKKLKTLVRNQINEIKALKAHMSSQGIDTSNIGGNLEEVERLQNKIKELQEKFKATLELKDNMIQSAKADLKSAQREIEGHLMRHNDELKLLHNKLIAERSNRDYLLANMTQELISALKSPPTKSPTKTKVKPRSAETTIIRPTIKEVHIPEHTAKDHDKQLTILYAAPTLPNFDESSGGKRALNMLKLLAKEHNVFVYSPRMTKQVHRDAVEALGIKVINHLKPNHVIEKFENIDVIIAAWFYSYFDIQDIVKHFTSAKFIVDSVDVHWVREERSLGKWEGLTIEKLEENKENEIMVYDMADIIWVVSEEDRLAVLEELPYADVRVVSNIHIMKPDTYVAQKPNKILFFGGYNHYPNINAVKILAQYIFPKILKEVPDAELIIAGSNAPEEIIELGELEGVTFAGYINFSDITQLYADSKLTIVPLTEGAGIKGKICEAIEYRTPVVTNDIGNEGIRLETGEDGFVTNDYDEMAHYAIQILQDKYDLQSITLKAQEKVEALLGEDTNSRVMNRSFRPTVDICIVTFNKKDLLKDCIDSVFKNTKYPFFNIIVYSNGCTDGTKEYLETLEAENENVEINLSETNDVFVIPNNRMMQMNPAHDVVLLNNDTQVTENWLTALVEEAYKSKKIGIVGSKILYPDNVLQEFGSELYASGSGMNIGKNGDPNDLQFMRSKKASYVSGCSMFIKRSTILRLGVFDEQFSPCYAEDSDYCYSAWEHNIEVNVTPKSVIYHIEGASSGTDINTGFKKFQKINIQKFLGKHGHSVEEINERVHEINKELPYL